MLLYFHALPFQEFHNLDPNFIKLFRLSQLIIEYLLVRTFPFLTLSLIAFPLSSSSFKSLTASSDMRKARHAFSSFLGKLFISSNYTRDEK